MFENLDDKDSAIVIDAMEEKKFKTGDRVIKEGDDGDELFVVESGSLECTKHFVSRRINKFQKGDAEPKKLKMYEAGDVFGELALLYNAPRAATIHSVNESLLWSLDRATFNAIVKDSAAKKREQFEDFLKSVKLLSNMDAYERLKLADALKIKKYANGEFIIKQGETGNVFYIINEGTAVATKSVDGKLEN
jgi:cAMP-dependent protein kinase regulator